MNTKLEKCKDYFEDLSRFLIDDGYIIVPSCNKDGSAYLCRKGTENEITYISKPDKSFRVSDHWNWYSSIKKCEDLNYIQCYSEDLRWPNRRKDGGASWPIRACCVGVFIDGQYRVIFGEKFDRGTKEWFWIDGVPFDEVKKMIQ